MLDIMPTCCYNNSCLQGWNNEDNRLKEYSSYLLNLLCHGSIAQLGEHLPYKQGVTGSSPVGPTRLSKDNQGSRCGGTGRRAGLKILLWQHSTGSIPVTGIRDITYVISLFCVIGNSLKFIVTQNLLWMRVVANTRKLF